MRWFVVEEDYDGSLTIVDEYDTGLQAYRYCPMGLRFMALSENDIEAHDGEVHGYNG